MTIIVRNETGMERDHHVPQDKEALVHTGDTVEAGDPLIRGPVIRTTSCASKARKPCTATC